MKDFRIERVIVVGNSDAFIAQSTCKHCGHSFKCDLRRVRLEQLLKDHLAECPGVARAPRAPARVLQFRKRVG